MQKGVEWEFNPPGASHYGGHYERKIGAVRRIMEAAYKQLGKHQLSRDEQHTLLASCAAIVNNTPLWAVSSSPDDPAPLTPAALLTMKEKPAEINIETFTERDALAYGPRRWRRCQYLADEFWRRWKIYYLQELQERSKWTKRKPCIAVDDIVLIKSKSEPRNSWPMAVVQEVKVSKDGLVRSALVRVSRGTKKVLNRAVCDLVVLVTAQERSDLATPASTDDAENAGDSAT